MKIFFAFFLRERYENPGYEWTYPSGDQKASSQAGFVFASHVC
jgi:hypothetical protein